MNEAIDIATLVGFVGMVCIIAAYAYLTWKQEPNPFILHGTNLIGAALWAGIFTSVGYVFGYSIGSVFARLEVMERGLGITLAVIAVALTLWFAWRQWGPALISRVRNGRGPDDDQRRLPSKLARIKSRSQALRGPGSEE